MNKWIKTLLFLVVLSSVAMASAIKTWVSGETLNAADINSVLSHIHNSLRGGTHTLITNADISASAAIAHSKLASPTLVPRAWGASQTGVVCSADPCTVSVGSGISAINWGGVGIYTYTLSVARPNTNYMVLGSGGSAGIYCATLILSTTQFRLFCYDGAAPAAANTEPRALVMDDD